jgi:glutathione reductase (NADPH)
VADFDLVIIGTGVAGRTAVEEALAAGLRTALVDRREFGGTCALRGCEPKKVLFAGAEPVGRVRAQSGHGIAGDARVDWRELVAFKRTFTESLPARFESMYAEMGATVLHGSAHFTSPATVAIDHTEYSAEHILIATGAKPLPLSVLGEELVTDSEAFMELAEMPERVAFIGGGFISFEFAPMTLAAGASPVILHRSARPLKGFDPDLVAMLVAEYAEKGIDVRTNAPVSAIERDGEALRIQLGDGTSLGCDLAVHGAGRVPDLDSLALVLGGVEFEARGIVVDGTMRSVSNPRVFSAGDAAAKGAPLTPVGIAQARVAVANIVAPGSAVFDPPVVASVAFSDPPLASVGLSEREAKERGLEVDVKLTDTSGWVSTQRVGLRHSGAKTLVERGSGRVLGAHLLGHGAEEVVNVFALAIERGATAEELRRVLWAYPTGSSEIAYLL